MPETLLDPSGKKITDQVLHIGRYAVIVRRGAWAIKMPLIFDVSSMPVHEQFWQHTTTEQNRTYLQNESRVYERLSKPHRHPVIMDHLSIPKGEKHRGFIIQMPYMSKGTVEKYIQEHKPLSRYICVAWTQSLAHALIFAHKKQVIVGDLTTRNLLVANDETLKLCPSSDSILISLDSTASLAQSWVGAGELSIKTDIFYFGSVAYEIVTGNPFRWDLLRSTSSRSPSVDDMTPEVDLGEDLNWPRPQQLPSTDGVMFGDIIRRCWEGQVENMEEVFRHLA